MILVSVGNHKALHLINIFFQIGNIGNHQINSQHVICGKCKSAVHDYNGILILKCSNIHADLLQTAQRNNLYLWLSFSLQLCCLRCPGRLFLCCRWFPCPSFPFSCCAGSLSWRRFCACSGGFSTVFSACPSSGPASGFLCAFLFFCGFIHAHVHLIFRIFFRFVKLIILIFCLQFFSSKFILSS